MMHFCKLSLLLTGLVAAEIASAKDTAQTHSNARVHSLHNSVAAIHSDMHDLMTAPAKDKSAEITKFMASVAMMAGLHENLGPVMEKLSKGLAHIPDGPAKEHAAALIPHIQAIDEQSAKLGHLLKNLNAAKDGSQEEKAAAVKALVTGMQGCAEGIKEHMAALRGMKNKYDAQPSKFDGKSSPAMGKLEHLLGMMALRLQHDLKDPELKTNAVKAKRVKLEALLFAVVKHAVDTQKALFLAAAKAYKEDPTPATMEAVKVVVKKKMVAMTSELKTKMMTLELAMAKLDEEEAATSKASATKDKDSQHEESSASHSSVASASKSHKHEADEEAEEADEEEEVHQPAHAHKKKTEDAEAKHASKKAEDDDDEDADEASTDKKTEDDEDEEDVKETKAKSKKTLGDEDEDSDDKDDDADAPEAPEAESKAKGAPAPKGEPSAEDIDSVLGAVDEALPDAKEDATAFAQLRAVASKGGEAKQLKK